MLRIAAIVLTSRVLRRPFGKQSGAPERKATTSMANGRDRQDRRQKTMNIRSCVTRAVAWCIPPNSEVEGQSMVEYSLIFILMIIVCFGILTTLSDTVNTKLFQVIATLPLP